MKCTKVVRFIKNKQLDFNRCIVVFTLKYLKDNLFRVFSRQFLRQLWESITTCCSCKLFLV